MARRTQLSVAEARRIALAAQGLAGPRPARAGDAALTRMFDRVQLVQIDSVNVLCRSQELPLWARLGAHD
ncbi:MAG: winged helix-turn-helix domain-containing protein, partial [Kofleriaceae bacterium]